MATRNFIEDVWAKEIELMRIKDSERSHINQVRTIYGMKHKINKVIFNNPATIVIWNDGTKTVVKAINEPFDKEKGLAMAVSKRFFGNKGNYYEVFKKWIEVE